MTPAERVARWTAADAAIGLAAEAEQLRTHVAQRQTELGDAQARLTQLANRVAQLEAENADLRGRAGLVPISGLARRAYRKARSVAASRLRR